MPIDGIKIVKQKRYNAISYTTIGMILSYLQESNIDDDNGCNNMLIDDIKIVKQKNYNAFSYTTIGLILNYLQESNLDEYNGGYNMLIDGIKIEKQKRNNTCGYAAAGMIINYLQSSNIDEDYLFENDPFDQKGITFSGLLVIYKKYLEGYDASLIREDKEGTLKIIKQSLKQNIPFQVLHLTENLFDNKKPVLHYAVLIGYDEGKEEFTLADPYGFNKKIGKDDFFEAISFRNDCLPEYVKKIMPSNAMISFTKRA